VTDDTLLAIDQGTSSTRAIGFSASGDVVAVEQLSFDATYPGPGWVEHDPEVIAATVLSTSRRVLQALSAAKRSPAAIGITNQRETTVLWDRRSGAPLHNAIVWQDRRTADRALVGQACFAAGDVKSTYGTGAFLVINTARKLVPSKNRLLSTIAYQLKGEPTYALEGSILSAGAAIQWLRDGLGIIAQASDIEALAGSAPHSGGVYLVPAFTGLGAPYWDPDARAALLGLTRATSRAEIARAALDSVAYQTYDLLDAMAADGLRPESLKVDGGMSQNNSLMQRLADVLGLTVRRPANPESTAFGAACLAGLGCGLYRSLQEIAALSRSETRFESTLGAPERETQIAGWRNALRRVRSS
jgi:glycerol kinase